MDRVAGFKPKCRGLLIGPSGSGKSAVAAASARHNGMDGKQSNAFLTISAANYVVFGAGTLPHTITVLRDFVRRESAGVVLLDEIDKAIPVDGHNLSAWALSVFGEILTILDCDSRFLAMGWEASDVRKFQKKFVVHGAGAWQVAAAEVRQSKNRGSLGFATQNHEGPNYANLVAQSKLVPEEVAFRFHPVPILISPPTREDYAEALTSIHNELNYHAEVTEELLDEATGSNLGVRWIEGYLTNVLISHQDLCPDEEEAEEEDDAPLRTISRQEYAQVRDKVSTWTLDCRRELLNLQSQRYRIEKRIEQCLPLWVLWHGDPANSDCILKLTQELLGVLKPYEAGGFAQAEYCTELAGRWTHVVKEAIDKYARTLDEAGALQVLVSLYELIDRINATLRTLLGVRVEDRSV